MSREQDDGWDKAKRRCRLTDEEIRMARELGFQPKSLIRNIPSPSQQWKLPVAQWLRGLYEEKFGPAEPPAEHRAAAASPSQSEPGNPDHPWPDKPVIVPPRPPEDFFELEDEFDDEDIPFYGFEPRFEPPSDEEIDEENHHMVRRQCLFRWAAQAIAVAMTELPEVQKIAAFGAVAKALRPEIPRFSQFRRHRIRILHECADLDLAVWMTSMDRLKELKRAMSRGLALVQETAFGGVAHHQVDVHLFDAATDGYQGRLCYFGQCPKPGKRECFVRHCGDKPFLRQFSNYRFHSGQFRDEPMVPLFDRVRGFLVRLPIIEEPLEFDAGPYDDDVPF
jgi:hypothetical protein